MARTKQISSKANLGGKKATKGGKGKDPNQGYVRKTHRFRAGTVALRKVRKYQRSTECVLRMAPFKRLVKIVMSQVVSMTDRRLSKSALMQIRESTEAFLVRRLRKAQDVALDSANHTTLTEKDIKTVAICIDEYLPKLTPETVVYAQMRA
jgi:histone H3